MEASINGDTFAGATMSNPYSTSNVKNLGRRTVTDANDTTHSYEGKIDEVIIEERAWSNSEIRKYYTQAKGRF